MLGGTRAAAGMPAFGDLLEEKQAKAIQAYVLFQSAEAARAARKP